MATTRAMTRSVHQQESLIANPPALVRQATVNVRYCRDASSSAVPPNERFLERAFDQIHRQTRAVALSRSHWVSTSAFVLQSCGATIVQFPIEPFPAFTTLFDAGPPPGAPSQGKPAATSISLGRRCNPYLPKPQIPSEVVAVPERWRCRLVKPPELIKAPPRCANQTDTDEIRVPL